MKMIYAFAAVLVALNLSMAEAQVAPSTSLPLSLRDAIQRGLEKNLGVLVQEQEVRLREGKRWQELADVLPHVSAGVFEGRQNLNPQAFGFPPPVVGPFNVFDARVFASQPLLDAANFYEAKMEVAKVTAEEHSYENVRGLVVTTVANLYLQASATVARLAASGDVIVAIDRATDADSLQARTRLQGERRRAVALQNTLTKQKLALARAIGLPHGQPFTLVDPISYAPLQPISLDDALQRAYRERSDLQAQLARVKSAEEKLRSANGRRLPTVHLGVNYGKIGPSISESPMTFGVQAIVRVPILEGGQIRGRVLEADAELRQQKARLEDLRDAIYYEIQNAMVDVQSAAEEAQLARESLAPAEALQAEDAFGVTSESYISALYTYNVAKLALARTLGVAEEAYIEFLGGSGR